MEPLADPRIKNKVHEDLKINGVPLKSKDGLKKGTDEKETIKNLEKALKEGVFAGLEKDDGNSNNASTSS